MQSIGALRIQQFHFGVTAQEVCANYGSVSSRLQTWVTFLLPRHTLTSTYPRGGMGLPSSTRIASVSDSRIFGCFSNLRTTMDSVAPMSKTAL